MSFFNSLRAELGFYLGAAALHERLESLGVVCCFPTTGAQVGFRVGGIVDPSLALRSGRAPVGNSVDLGEKPLLVITGANHGGKSTLLRALGVAQIMMQAGLFTTASEFRSPIAGSIFTHWAREEDEELRHGKLDEELDRMSNIVDRVRQGDLLLLNESFSSTNEAEGSQIAWDVTSALVRAGVRVCYVSHLYDFACQVANSNLGVEFLRAPRDEAGERSFQLEPGGPLPTSFGVELYDQAFGTSLARQ